MLPYLSTQVLGVRHRQRIQSHLVAGKTEFEISGIQDSGDLGSKSDSKSGKVIGDDFAAILPNGVVVIGDGVPPVHNALESTPYFGAYPYGLLPGLILENIALTAKEEESANDILKRANTTLGDLYKGLRLSPYIPHNRAGACFVIAKLGSESTELISGGDTIALWELVDGTCGWSKNQVFEVDQARNKDFTYQMNRATADYGNAAHQVVWSDDYYGACFRASRDRFTNNPQELNSYPMLDGAPFSQIQPLLQSVKFPTASLKWLMLLTDGCFPIKWSESMDTLFHKFKACIDSNLSSEDVFKFMRDANQVSPASHTNEPELTFLVIKNLEFFNVYTE